ncbi:hypothetical protein IC229_28285 [Spirosoma sp. BT702]|uniref:Uncharacterized protein n=1 Tax=Spirosoma profusum TaxID=2771354 RepID=A0A926Y0Z1_9BACT|nr:hypothetical protein [Spirosoma profusum]MBD2704573.1 hypothetical protein [Spirosoma profusum]
MLTNQHTLLPSIGQLAVGLVATFVLLAHSGRAQVSNVTAQNVTAQNVTPANVLVRSDSDPDYALASASYQVHAYVSQKGKVHLMINNPEHLRYKIEVVDQQNRSLYEEFTNHNRYNRRIDLSSLPENSCQIIVKIDNKRYQYKVRRQEAQLAFTLQPNINQNPTDEPRQSESERSPTPVTLD